MQPHWSPAAGVYGACFSQVVLGHSPVVWVGTGWNLAKQHNETKAAFTISGAVLEAARASSAWPCGHSAWPQGWQAGRGNPFTSSCDLWLQAQGEGGTGVLTFQCFLSSYSSRYCDSHLGFRLQEQWINSCLSVVKSTKGARGAPYGSQSQKVVLFI